MGLKINIFNPSIFFMGLDFPHTCTKINRAVNDIVFTIEYYMKDYIKYLCPDMPEKRVYELSRDWSKELCRAISNPIDMVIDTNINIRKQADYQIDLLESEIEKLKLQIKKRKE